MFYQATIQEVLGLVRQLQSRVDQLEAALAGGATISITDDIVSAVAEVTQVAPGDITHLRCKRSEVSRARWLVLWMLREQTGRSPRAVAGMLGMSTRSNGPVARALAWVDDHQEELAPTLEAIRERLSAGAGGAP